MQSLGSLFSVPASLGVLLVIHDQSQKAIYMVGGALSKPSLLMPIRYLCMKEELQLHSDHKAKPESNKYHYTYYDVDKNKEKLSEM